jgi:hypothetical protein
MSWEHGTPNAKHKQLVTVVHDGHLPRFVLRRHTLLLRGRVALASL